jgi:hypothetical protein
MRKTLKLKIYFSKFGRVITSAILISNLFKNFIKILLQSFTPFDIKKLLMIISSLTIKQKNITN